jgi:hypothetical protein
MSRGVKDLQAQIAMLERQAAASVESLHHIRARTSRVLAATGAFTTQEKEIRSLSHAVRDLANLDHVHDDSVDRPSVERELARLRAGLRELQLRFSSELASGTKLERASPSSRRRPWWRFWR